MEPEPESIDPSVPFASTVAVAGGFEAPITDADTFDGPIRDVGALTDVGVVTFQDLGAT